MMPSKKVGAGDTAQWPENGLVQCSQCDYSRENGDGAIVWCRVFENGHGADVPHICTAYRPVGWTLDHKMGLAA